MTNHRPEGQAMRTKLICTITAVAVFALPVAEALAAGRNWY
jgi:hypothetical protein